MQPGNAGTTSDWAWLVYAVFHPDAACASSYTDLDLELLGVALNRLDVFLSMTVSNKLPSKSGQSPLPRNTTYEIARVQVTTTAHVDHATLPVCCGHSRRKRRSHDAPRAQE
jgi:hypothetical protein